MRPQANADRPSARTSLTASRSAVIGLLLLGAAGLPPSSAHAQGIEIGRPFRVADSGEARRYVDAFERHRDAGRWEQAVKELGNLLEMPPERGFVVQVEDRGALRFEGVGRVGLRLFEALPPAGREAWESVFRAQAEALLARGLDLRRTDDLRAAARRYPARDVRRRAHEALASLALAAGDFATATHELRELIAVADSDVEQAGIFARIAFARSQVGDRDGVERVRQLAGPYKDVRVPGPEGGEPLGQFLERVLVAAGSGSGPGMGYPQFSGNQHGTQLSAPPPRPDPRPRWIVDVDYQQGSETLNDQPGRYRSRGGGNVKHRPVVPVVSRGVVYVNNGLRLRAVDLSSGNVIWQRGTAQRSAQWRDNQLTVHTAAVTESSVYAALASRADAPDMQRMFYGRIIVYQLPHRSLTAYDARTGETIWSHDDAHLAHHPDAAAISSESVASPPLVVGDDILVATWTFDSSFDVRLVCFDRHTGLTRWRRSIAQGQQELNLFGRPVKELATTALAELDGVVYFASGLGVAAGVDISDGEIRWLTAYPQTQVPSSDYWYETRERPVTWWPAPVVATRRNVVMAPIESPYLVAFDPVTGTVSWRIAHTHRPFDFEYFLGVSGDRAYILGDRLAAIDLATGARAWTERDAGKLRATSGEEDRAVGEGVLGTEFAYVPASDSIQAVRLSDGVSVEQWPLPEVGRGERAGGITSADGALLLTTRDSITAHYRFEDRRDRLLALIAESPDDPRLRLEAGEIFRGAGRLDDAISSLEIGTRLLDELAPRAREGLEGPLRAALYASYSQRAADAARSGEVRRAVRDLQLAVDAAHDRGDCVRALILLARIAHGDTELDRLGNDALRRVQREFSEVHVTLPGLGRIHAGAYAAVYLGERELAAGQHEAALNTWLDALESHADADLGRTDVRTGVAERIEAARAQRSELVTRVVRARARRAFDAARDAADPAALDLVARTYPDRRTQADAALLAADLHASRGDERLAVAILRSLLAADPEPSDAADALWKLASAYESLNEPAAERMTLQRLAREHGDALIDGASAAKLSAVRLAEPRLMAPVADLPEPDAAIRMLWESTGGAAGAGVPQIVSLEGRRPKAIEGRLVALNTRILELLDAETGRPVWRTPTGLEPRTVVGTDDALIVIGDDRGQGRSDVVIRSYAAGDGSPLWTRRLAGGYRATARGLGVMYILHAERDARGSATHSLSAVDIETGELVAIRDFDAPLFADVVVAEDAVIVFRAGTDSDQPPRTVVTLDGTTLALRGSTPLANVPFDNVAVSVEGSGVVVTLSDVATLVGVDVGTGALRWTKSLAASEVKSFHAVAGGIVVADNKDTLWRLRGTDGQDLWRVDLAEEGGLGWQGLAVADDLIAATLVPAGAIGSSLALALSAEDGSILWRHRIELDEGSSAHPHPVICRNHVAYEVNERFVKNSYRSRVLLLDRKDGAERAVIAHESIGKSWQRVVYDRGYIGLTVPGELAVFGR